MTQIKKYLVQRARQAQARQELHSMTDRELEDIGVNRYDINRLVSETL